ncbi:Asp-tRNA(Asn)/Glu-tRNA(Gln) amidotransferase subunit GatC [Verrucomicrobiaceae bacterium R5-34]|uniref:Aspartyl/glutamyl-tRNA(Asn/Gln) amidotransferase subunit C n=1 Tax=Oceaniferula flava TaxID=2800421 RepID=A0AAE2SDU7_9BACT|nr:Asp-tRNA(Asn)/Glu-tRNA(Gln) amidotransferase subunit GatC [Oceaniferula flavus]MBK1830084.1 Asp-tRNA(Asn)/Glu-tRNA(Gln) amidotransferase subunit GatC [Verrucomicrobiaceae bacterium R5-34]MBK1855069.1 Asp-tRNA(Asn)/Glu-tRNA(Gln) amidotransferase subunit GatC [Oceaniferula flavus]MBM1136375.1 Asp-tRNA(Asn)/Glu-tRNA(Gln) amidotransferase subunit GatC [Oceaniferula flavus]
MSSENMDVRYVADLARIDLTDEECETFQGQLDAILGYIEQLKDADVDGIDPTAHASQVFDRLREDVSQQNLGQADLLANAPDSGKGQIRVPKVVDA